MGWSARIASTAVDPRIKDALANIGASSPPFGDDGDGHGQHGKPPFRELDQLRAPLLSTFDGDEDSGARVMPRTVMLLSRAAASP